MDTDLFLKLIDLREILVDSVAAAFGLVRVAVVLPLLVEVIDIFFN